MPETTKFTQLRAMTAQAIKALEALRIAYSATLDAVKEDGSEATDLIQYYGSIRKAQELIGVETDKITGLSDHVKFKALPETYDRDGIRVLTDANGDRVHITVDVLASILKDNRDAAYTWLRKNNHGDIIVEYVFPGTLSAFARTLIEETGKDLPPESNIGIEMRPKANFTAGKDSPYRSIKRGGVGA
jgi:hypothetical protein